MTEGSHEPALKPLGLQVNTNSVAKASHSALHQYSPISGASTLLQFLTRSLLVS